MTDLILTIAIPTFNRNCFLGELLESISRQYSKEIEGSFEVFIFDNGSTDNTEILISELKSKVPFCLRYHRHAVNIGANQNIAYAAKAGDGRYVWVLGDDEIIPDGAFNKILKSLKLELDYLILNYAVYDRAMRQIKVKHWFRISGERLILGRSEAMRILGSSPTFISAVIARRGILDSLEVKEIDCYASYGFNQLYSFYKALPIHARGLVSKEILVFCRSDNSSGYNWNRYFVTGLGVIFNDLHENEGYSIRDIHSGLCSVIVRYHIKRVLNESAEGRGNREFRKLAYPYYSKLVVFWLLLFPATFLPHWIMGPIKKLKKRLVY